MKKNKVIRLTENDLVNIIKKVLIEQNQEEILKTESLINEVSNISGSEVVMFNDYGLNRYKGSGSNKIFAGYETYIIKDVWFPEYKGGKTVAFTVQKKDSETDQMYGISGKTGLMKGAFKRESKDTNLPIQFRWDCKGHFEKGLGGKGQELKRYGGIKQDYLNNDLALVIVNRPFCDYPLRTEVKSVPKNYAYRNPPR